MSSEFYSYKDLKDYTNACENTADGYYHFGKDVYNDSKTLDKAHKTELFPAPLIPAIQVI